MCRCGSLILTPENPPGSRLSLSFPSPFPQLSLFLPFSLSSSFPKPFCLFRFKTSSHLTSGRRTDHWPPLLDTGSKVCKLLP